MEIACDSCGCICGFCVFMDILRCSTFNISKWLFQMAFVDCFFFPRLFIASNLPMLNETLMLLIQHSSHSIFLQAIYKFHWVRLKLFGALVDAKISFRLQMASISWITFSDLLDSYTKNPNWLVALDAAPTTSILFWECARALASVVERNYVRFT